MAKPSIFDRLAAVVRTDGWANPLTGLGTTRDKMTATTFGRGRELCDEELETLYAENDMAARICDALPEDATREGFSIKIETQDAQERRRAALGARDAPRGSDALDSAEAADVSDAVQDQLETMGAVSKLVDAWVWGRALGFGAIVLGADDGARDEALAEPLQIDRVRTFDHMNVVDKRHVTPLRWYTDPTAPGYGRPETYLVTPHALPSGQTSMRSSLGLSLQARAGEAMRQRGVLEIHESRMVVFGGVRTPIRRRQELSGSDLPLLQRVNSVLTQFGVAWDSLAHILQDGYQGVYKVQGLIDAISAPGTDALQTRLSLMDMARSVVRSVVVDAELESFERQSVNLSNLDKIMELFMVRLSAAADMPATVLMRQSPAGMNATGESDIHLWYDRVEYGREHILRPALRRVCEVAMAAKDGPTGGRVPDSWTIDFPRLWAPSEVEAAGIRLQQAQADQIYFEMGAVTESEIAMSRFTPDGWSPETAIDRAARQAMVETELDDLANPPEPPPAPALPAPGEEPAPEPESDPEPDQAG